MLWILHCTSFLFKLCTTCDWDVKNGKEDFCSKVDLNSWFVLAVRNLYSERRSSSCVPPFQRVNGEYKIAHVYRLLACTIQKNFSTTLTAIIFCKERNEYSSLAGVSREFNLSAWTMIAVIRDPLERFVSGFADKCLRRKEWEGYPQRCCGCKTNLTCFMEKLYDKMMLGTFEDYVGDFDAEHFFPQSWRCEFNFHLSQYHILKFDTFKAAEFIRDLAATLKKQNVPESFIAYIVEESVLCGHLNHTTRGTVEQEETRRSILSSRYLMDLLIKMFYYDFVLFGFPLPIENVSSICPQL
ncbi:unnamed protein product [Cylicocyclus nassatus]|uniref:Carbohydrate sulfotransferase n=1 Tax=Cylicocyclus nassatus TaxID=53992 RepID=A0AA36GPZ5_CYLNA|nr:unnamed protein product [Cylicocyclus nassatus]